MSPTNEQRHQDEPSGGRLRSPEAHFWTTTRILLACLVLILIAVVGPSFCSRTAEISKTSKTVSNQPTAPVSEKTGASAPGESTELPASLKNAPIRTLDGGSLQLSDYAGKVVVLDLWATWCGPCRLEIPHLVKLNQEYAARGVEVVGLTVEDPEEDAKTVRDFAHEFQINYKLGWAEQDFALALMDDNDAIPQTFVISRDGRLLNHLVGFDPRSSPAMLREAIEQALGGAD